MTKHEENKKKDETSEEKTDIQADRGNASMEDEVVSKEEEKKKQADVILDDVSDLPKNGEQDASDISSVSDMKDVVKITNDETTAQQSTNPLAESHEVPPSPPPPVSSPPVPTPSRSSCLLPVCYVLIPKLDDLKKAYNERKRASSSIIDLTEQSDEEVIEKPHKSLRHTIDTGEENCEGPKDEGEKEVSAPKVIDRRAAIEKEKDRMRIKEKPKANESGHIKKQMARPTVIPRKKMALDDLIDTHIKQAAAATEVQETTIPKKDPPYTIFQPEPPSREPLVHETTDKKLGLLKYEKSGRIKRMDPASPEFAKLSEELRYTQRKGKRMELDAAWTVHNESNTAVFDACTVQNTEIGYHSSNLDALLNIVSDGFRLPPDTFNKAGDNLLLLGRMIYFATQAGNSLHYADECDYSLRVDMKVGRVKHTETKMSMEPSILMRNGFDSIHSKTVSKRGEIWAIPHPSQVASRYLLKFCKIPQDVLSGVVSRSSKLPLVGYVTQKHSQSGFVDENRDFICVWDKHPAFTIHCLVLPKKKIFINEFKLEDLEALDEMESFANTLIARFRDVDSAWQFASGFSMYSAEKIQRKFSNLLTFSELRKFLTLSLARSTPSFAPPSFTHSFSPPPSSLPRTFEDTNTTTTTTSVSSQPRPSPPHRSANSSRKPSTSRHPSRNTSVSPSRRTSSISSSSRQRTRSPPSHYRSRSPRRSPPPRHTSRFSPPRHSSHRPSPRRGTSHPSPPRHSSPPRRSSSTHRRSPSPSRHSSPPRRRSSPHKLPSPPSLFTASSSHHPHSAATSHIMSHSTQSSSPPLSLPSTDTSEPMAIDEESTFRHEVKNLQKRILDEYGVEVPLEVVQQSAFDLLKTGKPSNYRPNAIPSAPLPATLDYNPAPVPANIPNTPNYGPNHSTGPNLNVDHQAEPYGWRQYSAWDGRMDNVGWDQKTMGNNNRGWEGGNWKQNWQGSTQGGWGSMPQGPGTMYTIVYTPPQVQGMVYGSYWGNAGGQRVEGWGQEWENWRPGTGEYNQQNRRWG